MNKKGNMEGGETMQIFPETGRMTTKIFTIHYTVGGFELPVQI